MLVSARAVALSYSAVKLLVILKEFQPMSSRYLIITDRRTDRQTKAISIHRAVKRKPSTLVPLALVR